MRLAGLFTIITAAAIDVMLMMLRTRDAALHDHSRRVGHLAVKLALAMGVTEPQLSDIERGALLHDIGKIEIPEAILFKPAPLTDNEARLVRQQWLRKCGLGRSARPRP